MIGTAILQYRILEKLGEGGMGVVYKAEDTRLERFVALKFLPKELAPDTQMRERMLREARAASALNHPNICTIYDVVEQDGWIFIVMEFLDGLTLKELVQAGPLEIGRLLNIAGQVLDGLEAAHSQGIIHRDIKLANIFVTQSGRVKILDFGLAKKGVPKQSLAPGPEAEGRTTQEEHLNSGLAALGTVAYMSPEQALGKPLDARTDLFSFGIVLYEMATARAPFYGDTTGMLFLSVIQGNPEPPRHINPELPEGLQQVIERCLQKEREERYQTAAEIRQELEQVGRAAGWRGIVGGMEKAAATEAEKLEATETSPREAARATPSDTRKKVAWRSWKVRFASAAAFVVILGGSLYVYSHKAAALKARDSIVLADFTNTTGEAIFDGSLKQAVRIDLEQSPFLNVLQDSRVSEVLKEMGRPGNQRLTVDVTRQVCLRSNSKALIAGSITPKGSGYLVGLKAVVCEAEKEIGSSEAEAANRSQVLRALNGADKELRRKLGESLPSIQQYGQPLEENTTSSLEALQAYTEGLAAAQLQTYAEAIRQFQRAVQLDSNFAQAQASLAGAYISTGQYLLAEGSLRRAYELRNRVSKREQLYITAAYYGGITGQIPLQRETCQEWVRLYPDDYAAYNYLGNTYNGTGELEKAAQAYREAIRIAPHRLAAHANEMLIYEKLERYDEAKAMFNAARAHNLDNEVLRIDRYVLGFLENDVAAMREQIQWAEGKAGAEDRLLEDWAASEAYYGRYAKARELEAKAKEAALRDGAAERAMEHQAFAALREAEVGNRALARRWAGEALASAPGKEATVLIALSSAKAGDNRVAEKLAALLNSEHPLDTLVQNYDLPVIRALVEINQNRSEEAVAQLQAAATFEHASTIFGGLQAAYVRGLAYLQARKGREAAAEFQKLLDHPGLVEISVTGALARLQLARAEKLSGDQETARRHYQDFLDLWKDADPDVPILKQAKAEYAKLN